MRRGIGAEGIIDLAGLLEIVGCKWKVFWGQTELIYMKYNVNGFPPCFKASSTTYIVFVHRAGAWRGRETSAQSVLNQSSVREEGYSHRQDDKT